jgi:hypothetical protein
MYKLLIQFHIFFLEILKTKMKKIIFLILYLVAFIECIKFKMASRVCFPKEENLIKCNGKYNYYCGQFVCSENEYSCQLLSLFSGLKGKHREKYEIFINEVKDCPEPPKYKWKPNDVCLNTNDCVILIRTWPFNRIKQNECKCTGKSNYRCNRDYCALNKLACEGITKNLTGIKKCLKNNNKHK